MKKKEIEKILKLVKDNYNTIASDFDITRKKKNCWKIEKICQEIESGATILDLACGNGRLLENLKNKKIDYLGIDISDNLIKLAKKNYPNFEFKTGDILNLEKTVLNNKKYDYIFCLAALQHIPSNNLRLQVLVDIKKHLKGGARVIISNWNLWQSKHFKKIIYFTWQKIVGKNKLDFKDVIFFWKGGEKKEKSKRYYHAFTKKELLKLAKRADFKKIKIEKDKYNYWLYLEK